MLKDILKKWEKNPEYPELYSGPIKYEDLKKGMGLNDLIDVADF